MHRWRLGIAGVVTVVALVALSRGACSRPPAARAIVIAQSGDFFLYAPLYVAVDAGLFKQQQLDVSITSTGGDDKTWAAVLSGGASFGVADPTFIAVSGQRGQPGRAVASIVNGVPFWGVTFRNDIPTIKDPKDLKGYSVATFPEPSTAYVLQRQMFVNAGLAPTIRQGAFGTLLPMLDAKQADIALELEPNVSQAVNRGARVVYGMPQVYGDFAITGLTATPSLIASDPSLVRQVICGLQLALDYIHSRPDDTLAILLKRFPGIEPGVAKAALQRVIADRIIPPDVTISPDAWAKAIALRVDAGQIDSATSGSQYLDMSVAATVMSSPACRLTK